MSEEEAFRAGWEAAMQFADYPRTQDERDWDQADVEQSWLAFKGGQ